MSQPSFALGSESPNPLMCKKEVWLGLAGMILALSWTGISTAQIFVGDWWVEPGDDGHPLKTVGVYNATLYHWKGPWQGQLCGAQGGMLSKTCLQCDLQQ